MLSRSRPSSPVGIARICFALSFAFLLALFPCAPARAAATDVPRLALHLLPVTSRNSCDRPEATPPCAAIVSRGELYPHAYYAYLLVTNADAEAGVAGVQLGLEYDGTTHQGVDIYSWANCADLNFAMPGWPLSGTGNTITWSPTTRCQRTEPGGPGTGVVAAAGYFYLAAYSADELRLVPHPLAGVAAIASCAGVETHLVGYEERHDPSLLGYASFSDGGGSSGYNPCADAPPPISCLIEGPEILDEGASGTYSAPGARAGTSFAWSVSGSASIVGSASSPTVTLQADGHGEAVLGVTMIGGGARSDCFTPIRITVPTTACNLYGPDQVSEGAQEVTYYAFGAGAADTYLWEVSGNATLTTDPAGQWIHVNVGDPGAFEVTVHDRRAGQPELVCRKTVSVTPITCQIYDGPVPAFVTDYLYLAGPEIAGATYDWQVSGNAAIHGSHQDRTVLLNIGAPGTFDLSLTVSRGARTVHCAASVPVQEGASSTGPNANTKLVLHLAAVTPRVTCGDETVPSRCNAAVTNGALFPSRYFAYLVVAEASPSAGLAAIECGVDYDGAAHSGVDVFSWSLCASAEARHSGPHGPWPAPGSGNSILWDSSTNCQRAEPGGAGTGVMATAGYFYLAAYTPGELRITASPFQDQALALDCDAHETLIGGAGFPANTPSHLGRANFTVDGAARGFNPCSATSPVRVTTWSAIKGLYGVPGKAGKP